MSSLHHIALLFLSLAVLSASGHLHIPVHYTELSSINNSIYNISNEFYLLTKRTGLQYRLIPSPLCSVFNITSTTGILYTQESINITDIADPNTDLLTCMTTDTGQYLVLSSYNCFIVASTDSISYGLTVNVHLLPTAHHSLPPYLHGEVVGGLENALVVLDRIPLLIDCQTEPNQLTNEYMLLDTSDSFSINVTSTSCHGVLQLVTTTPLSPETSYNLSLYHTPTQTLTQVLVNVVGGNRYPPVFIDAPSSITISELLPVGSVVTGLAAVDNDTNGYITYSLYPVTNFNIHHTTGQVYLSKPLDYETSPHTNITVKAVDSGYPGKSTESTITIFITDDNEARPSVDIQQAIAGGHHEIINDTITVSESTTTDSILARLVLTDGDSSHTFINMDSRTCHNCFSLSLVNITSNTSNTGYTGYTAVYNLLLANGLDYEGYTNTHVILINATDNGAPPLTTLRTINIQLIDTNDPPYFSSPSYEGRVSSGSPTGTSVLFVTATDQDAGDNGTLVYSIVNGSGSFTIHPSTGLVTVHSPSLVPGLVLINVSVHDTGPSPLYHYTSLVVMVTESDTHPPVFPDPYPSTSVSESWNQSLPLYHFNASDPDLACSGSIHYSLLFSEPTVFYIDQVSGLLYLNESLDHELYSTARVSVSARSLGNSPDLVSTATLSISVQDEDDGPSLSPTCPCPPVFLTPLYAGVVREDTGTGAEVLTVRAIDYDQNDVIRYSSSGSSDIIDIDSDSGQITLASTLDRDIDHISFNVIATDQTNRYSSVPVLLKVLHVTNSNRPSFTSPLNGTIINLNESTDTNQVLITISATDHDIGVNAELRYWIRSGNQHGLFYLDSATGEVWLTRPLDYETDPHTYSLVFDVSDLSSSPLDTGGQLLTVTFNIMDSNDHTPLFNESLYYCYVLEGRDDIRNDNGTGCVVKAADGDSTNGDIVYSIDDRSSPYFTIGSTTGLISGKDSVVFDYERNRLFILIVTAADGGSPPLYSTVLVYVHVVNDNDNPLQFIQPLFSVYLPLHLPANTTLFNAHAFDRDGTDITYSLLGEGTNYTTSTTGLISINRPGPMDPVNETVKIISLGTDSNGRTNDYNLYYISGVNFNSLPPQFIASNPPIVSISRRAVVGTHLVTMVTWDPDHGLDGVPRYFIIGGTGVGYFAIHETNGSVVTRRELSALTTPTLSLVVMATDSGPHPQFSLYNLTIVVINDHKIFIDSPVLNYTISDKYSFTGHTFGYVHVHVNNGRVLNYAIPSVQENLPFAINRSTGGLSVNGTLDEQWYSFSVVVSDSTDSTVCIINVRVLDTVNNFRPEFSPPFSRILLPASFPPNNSFIKLFVTDGDNGNNADSSYSIQSPLNSPIGVVPTSGELFLLTTPTFNNTVITIRANNIDLFSDFNINVTLYHTDTSSNFDLISINNDSILVPESINVGSVIYSLPGSSDGRPLFYYLTNNDDNNGFTVHINTGTVYVTSRMDHELQHNYILSFIINDGRSNSDNKYFNLSLSLADVNDNPSYFTQDNFIFSLPEDSPLDSIIGSINITDSDSVVTSNVIYSIIDWLHPLAPSLFNITSSGVLILTGPLDRETLSTHSLTVSVKDGQFEQLARVIITIEDIDDNHPSFTGLPHTLVIPEDRLLGDVVTIVTAFDPDDPLSNSSIVYSLFSSGILEELPFRLDPSTGVISINGSLDYESVTSYNLFITAANSTNSSSNSTHSLSILVSDIIDTYPFLHSMEVSVYENQTSSNYVTNTGTSSPPPHPITYSILYGNDLNQFYIEEYSGSIRTLVPLDREMTDYYNITVRGSYSDQYYTDVSVLISVLDINDNNPSISISNLTFLVSEDANVSNQIIFDLNPIDLDQGNNGSIRSILILDSESETIFDIDTSGRCTLKRQLNREEKDIHQFKVLLIDNGSTHPLASTYLITVLVTDVNDNDPVFKHYQSTLTIRSPVLNNEVLYSFTATDTDGGGNGMIQRYFISGGSGEGVFNIDPLTGDLRGLELFEMESNYSLMIGALDGGGRSAIINISLIVSYCRFNKLAFTPPSYTVTIPEDTPPPSSLLSPPLTDFNTPGVFRYSLSAHNDYFIVNASTGSVSLLSPLDRELIPVHYLVILAEDISANVLRVAKATVTVMISDVNDNAPVFKGLPYAVFLSDTQEIGSYIFTVQATDSDTNNNSVISYYIINDPISSLGINSSTGVLYYNQTVDPGITDIHFTVTIGAVDNGLPQLRTNTSLRLTLINSNAPNFSAPLYTATLPEDTSPGTTVVRLLAEPRADNALLFYSISDTGDLRFPFSINPESGVITVNDRGLDYETTPSYSFIVQAEEIRTGLYSQATVQVAITDINDQVPSFNQSSYIINVPETISKGSIVLTVAAVDGDTPPNAQVTYSLSPSTSFTIHPLTGAIATNSTLDYEAQTSYQLTLVARDSGATPLEGSASLRIIVTNVNDNPPVFIPLSPISVSEGGDPGTVVAFIRAMDADSDEITYSIIHEQEGDSNFQLLTNGLLRLNTVNVSLTDTRYVLNVSASDGLHVVYTYITINIDDINNHSPAFNQSEYSATVLENSPSGVALIRVNATDSDRGINAEITYSMIGSSFTIDETTGLISTSSNNIDREATPTHSLIIIARDGGGLTDTAAVTISVTDVNDNPPSFTQSLYGALLAEGEDYNNHQVLTVLARDPDQGINGTVSYNIITSNFNLFSIGSSTGAISVTGSLNYETNTSFSFNITATDGGGRVSEVATVTINITNVADTNPYYSEPMYNLLVPEDTPTGPVYRPHVTFAEGCTPSGYSIFGEGNGPFSYNTNGYISLNGLLDRETTDSYWFVVTVQCIQANLMTNPPTFQTRFDGSIINITITDVNERPVITSSLYISSIISEGAALNSTVTIVQALDTDLGLNGTLQYRLGSTDTPFTVDTVSGALLVSGTLDRERQQLYTLNVLAYDLGSPSLSSSATVIIAIQDINDNPPSFICTNDTNGVLDGSQCHYSISVPEDVELNHQILTLGTNDSDITGSTTFLLNSTAFNVTSTTDGNGVISTAVALDRETNDQYTLSVIANDGVFTVEAFLLIIVTDVNDNRPSFSAGEYVVDIIENYRTQTVFITLNATDKDYGNNSIVTYTLLANPSSSNISINSSTGQVSFLISPDHEVANRLEYYIRASDIGGLEDLATLSINIIDINDNIPVFTAPNYTASIYENTTANVEVLLVSATDSDSGSNALIRYDIDLESSQYFSIDPVTGLIRARAHLIDRETNEVFNILVTARDSGEGISLYSSTNVSVYITDINDNPPLFTDTSFTLYVYENASVDTVIHSFIVTDSDDGVNAELTYDIAGTGKESFLLETTPTGLLLKVNGELNSESVELYSLVLTATDGGIPALKTSVLINIHVLDQNEHLPTFNRPLYTFTIREDQPPTSIIDTITASDLDPADSNLTYRFKGSVSDFSVNERTGEIIIGGRGLDFERVRNYTLILLAVEPRLLDPQTAQTVIEITVRDVNDNPPAFLCSYDHTHFCTNHSYSVSENIDNVILGQMRVKDVDTVTDPDQIRFSISAGGTDINNRTLFSIDSLSGHLSLLSPLDREEQDYYVVTVTASDGGTPNLIGYAQVLIQVTDVNDNGPQGGMQYIIINLLAGDLGSVLNQAVFTNDSDIVNNYTFTVTGGRSDEIAINNGLITSTSLKLTPGQYSLSVGLTDALYNGTIVHTRTVISIIINDVTHHALDHGFTLLLSGITPLTFLSDFLIDFNATLTSLLTQELNQLIHVSFIDIKSTERSLRPAGTLLTISVCYNDRSCVQPDLVQHYIHRNKESIGNIDIESVDISECSNEPCANNGLCSETVDFSLSKSFITSPHVSYLGLVTERRSTCTCFSGFTGSTCSETCIDCKEASLCDGVTCDANNRCVVDGGRPVCVEDCDPSPCLNGGRCIPQDPGHHCSCPLGYNGPNCERTTATFNGQSHAMFPSLALVSNGMISFELITDESEGVLVYGGHFDVGFNDSLLIYVINNSLITSVSLGGYEYQLIVNEFPIGVKEWITVTFEYDINVRGRAVKIYLLINCLFIL